MAGVLLPDVEAAIITALRARLDARPEYSAGEVWIGNVLPSPVPAYAILVRNDGGSFLGDVRATVRVGVNVFAPTLEDASDLANLTAALLQATEGDGPIRKVRVTLTPYRMNDETGHPRMYLITEITFRSWVTI